jgi:type I restriction enzyme S subunit
MNASRLLEHFDRISEAPDAIPKLRQSILSLAVRGRLVPQDEREDPASTLLGKRRLSVPVDAAPWDLPSGWSWTSFTLLGEAIGGGTPDKGNADYWRGTIPWVSPKDMKVDIIADAQDHISELAVENSAARSIPPGALLMVVRGMILVHSFPTAVTSVRVAINQDMKAVVPFRSDIANFLLLMSKGMTPEILRLVLRSTHGTCKLLTADLFSAPLPFPPIAEQERIVAKVAELMTLCEQLEAARRTRNQLLESATTASVSAMAGGRDPKCYLANFERLSARPEQIDLLRSAVVDLALRGRLVGQVPGDKDGATHVRELEAKITRHRKEAHLVSAHTSAVDVDEMPFRIPVGWTWARLSSLFNSITDGDHMPPPTANEGVAFLTIGNISGGTIEFAGCRLVPPEYFSSLALHRRPAHGDLLYTVVGATYGRPVVVDTTRDFCVQRHVAILKPAAGANLRFLNLLLRSAFVYDQASRSITGAAQPTIPIRALRSFVVPVPPLDEQVRIVNAVDTLMGLGDQLDAALREAGSGTRQLMDMSLREALDAPADEQRRNVEPCIYCGSVVPRTKREHVVSQALGTFEQNWTLTCVCDECNAYFSKHLEIALGRDSIEGFIRVEAGVKPPETIDRFLNMRAVFSLLEPGLFEGARVVMKSTGDGIGPVAPPQVGFRSEGEDWQYFLERELNTQAVGRLKGPKVEIKILGRHGDEDLSRLVARLADLGIEFAETSRAMDQPLGAGQTVGVLHAFDVDATLRRAAAKIGFNYATKILGPDIMRRSDFDRIRRFIRFGDELEQLVTAQEGSVLTGSDAATSRGHALAVGWLQARNELIGVVSLFNRVTYGIRLCESQSAEWAHVSARHLFDPVSRVISELSIEPSV